MDEIAEQQEVAQEISQTISNPMSPGFGNDVDDAELELELEAMEQEDLEKELLQVHITTDGAESGGGGNKDNKEQVDLYTVVS